MRVILQFLPEHVRDTARWWIFTDRVMFAIGGFTVGMSLGSVLTVLANHVKG